MTTEQKMRARRILAALLPEGRNAPRNQLTRAKASLDLGRGRTYLSDFINDRKSSLGAAEVAEIERMLDLPRGWLLYGKGDVPRPDYKVPDHPLAGQVPPVQPLDEFEAETLDLIPSLRGASPPAQRQSRPPYVAEPNAEIEGPARLPWTPPIRDVEELGAAIASVGSDDSAFELNGEVVDRVVRPPGLVSRPGVFALRVANHSMWPRFRDGERVYLDTKKPAIEDCVVVELKPDEDGRPGKAYVKMLVSMDARKVVVEQFNPPGRLEFGRDEILRLFRVIPNEELWG